VTPAPDVVVVGSGFGGSVVAMRAAQAGLRVLVLERGRAYAADGFPRDPRHVDEVLWTERRRGRTTPGLYDLRFLSGLGTVTAAGVGGGSLVFAGVLVEPDVAVMAGWPRALREGLAPGFARAKQVLAPEPLPTSIVVPKRDRFLAAAASIGRSAVDVPLAIGWTAQTAPGGVPCRLDARCELGCSVGAKRSADVTYLAAAVAAGAQVRTLVAVSHVAPAPHGGYVVHLRRTDGSGVREVVTARQVVLSAGTLGSTEVLLRSRDVARTLPWLSARLGHGMSANGDFLALLRGSREPLHPWLGPDVTSVLRSRPGEPAFSIAAPTSGRAAMEVLAALGSPPLGWLRPLTPVLWPALGVVLRAALRAGLLSRPVPVPLPGASDPERTSVLFGIGNDDAGGQAVLRRGRLDVRWSYAQDNAVLVAALQDVMAGLAREYGGTAHPLWTWEAFGRPISFHPLGGCWAADDPAGGVVSPSGEVFGCPGLFVADGSAVPGSLGVHPALTIAALAEHVAEHGLLAGRG